MRGDISLISHAMKTTHSYPEPNYKQPTLGFPAAAEDELAGGLLSIV